jgi:hypothetical protein
MKRLAYLCWLASLLLTALMVRLNAQPGVCYVGLGGAGVTSGCPCPAGQAPCVQTYISNINASLRVPLNFMNPLPQNVIPSGLELVGDEANWAEADAYGCWLTSPNSCIFQNAAIQNAFIDNVLVKSGATYIDWNLDWLPYVMTAEYIAATGFNCSATFTANNCARLAYNLTVHDAITAHIAAANLKIRMAPISFGPPGQQPWLVCGISSPSTMTVATMDACLGPVEAAIVAHNHNLSPSVPITTMIVNHEATGAFTAGTGQTFSPADWATSIAALCSAVHGATGGSGVKCGSGFVMTESSYVTQVTSSPPAGMQVGGIDFYFESLPSTWASQPAVYAGWCASFLAAGMTCELDESGPWGHCPSSGAPQACNGSVYEGCGWANLQTYGVHTAFASLLPRYASAMGATYVTTFNTLPFAAFQAGPIASPNACTDNSLTGYTAQVLQSLGTAPTAAGYEWLAGNTWPSVVMEGRLAATGYGKFAGDAGGAPDLCTQSPTGLPSLGGTLPALPVSCYQPPYPGTPTSTVTASSFADLQAKISGATCGENIIVPAGSYLGDLVIPGPPSSGTVNTAVAASGTANTLGNTATLTSGSVPSTWAGLTITINGSPHIVATTPTSSTLTTYDALGTHTGVSYAMGPVASLVSGGKFMQSWAGKTITLTIGGTPTHFTVANDYPPDISPTSLLLAASAGNQTGVAYSINAGNPVACPATNPVLISSSQLSHIPQYAVPPQSQASTACGASCYFASIIGNTNATATITIEDGVSGWYFAGIEATLGSGIAGVYPIVFMGEYSNSVAALPQYITFDRVLVDAPAGTVNQVTEGINLNSPNGTVEYSNIWGVANSVFDSQAVLISNSPGPSLIAANHLEATGENIMLWTECPPPYAAFNGFGVPGCPVPSDITVRLNHFYKPLAWQSQPVTCTVPSSGAGCYVVKDLFEIKMGQRVLLDSNILDTTFSGGQNEAIIVNCGGGTSGVFPAGFVCQDFTATNNLVEHAPLVGVFAGYGAAYPASPLPMNAAPGSSTADRILFRNNLGIDIDAGNPQPTRGAYGFTTGYGSATGYAWQIQQTQNMTFDHNTIINTPFGHDSANGVNGTGLLINDPGGSSATDINFRYTNSFHYASPNGGGAYPGNTVANFIGATWGGDVFVGDWWDAKYSTTFLTPFYPAGIIPASNALSPVNSTASPVFGYQPCNVENKPIGNVTTPGCWALDWALVGLTDFANCNAGTNLPGCALTSGSAFHNQGTDGLDVGAKISTVLAAISSITW